MALRYHHGDCAYGAAELDDTTCGTGIVLLVPRDADNAVLQSELSKLPGLEGTHMDLIRQQGFCVAQFDSHHAARHAHDTIMAADSQLGPYLVQCYYIDHGAAPTNNIWGGGPSERLRLPETLYETGPLTQQMPAPSSPRAAFKDPPGVPTDTGSQRGPSSLTSTMTPHSNSTTVGGGGAPAGGFWSPPLSLTGGAGASAPNSSGAPGSSSQLALLAQQRLGQQAGAAQPRYDAAVQSHQLAQIFQGLSTSQDDFPCSGGPTENGAGNPGGGVRGLPSLRTTAFPPSSMPFDSDGVPSAGSGASSNWHGRVACGTPSAYPSSNMHPSMSGTGYSGLRELGSGGAPHAYGMPPPPFAPHAQRLPSNNLGGYSLDMVGPPSADEFTGPGGGNNGGPYVWQGHMPGSQGASGGGGSSGSAERSKQRLFVVVSKSATEEQIAKQFKKFGGMEYCNLKRDKRTGASKGYCFVNFSTAESAAAAMKALNGIEFPTGSGKNLRVEYSEVLPSARQGMPPTSRPSSTNSHGSGAFKGDGQMYDGHLPAPYPPKAMHDPRAPRSQEHPGSQGHQQLSPEHQAGMAYAGNITDFVASHNFDPSSGMFAGPGAGGYPASGSRGGGTARSRGEAPIAGDPCRLFVHVSPHLPEHALRHLFEGFGTVVSVIAVEDESCYWVVRFEDAAAAATATNKLNGSNILGSMLNVEPSDTNGPLRTRFLGVSSISTYSSHYPSSRGPSSQGISSTGSMQATAFGGKMAHYYDGSGWGVGSGGSHFPQHTHASPPRFMPQVVEGGGIRGSSAAAPPGARNGSGSLPSSGQSPSPQPGAYVQF